MAIKSRAINSSGNIESAYKVSLPEDCNRRIGMLVFIKRLSAIKHFSIEKIEIIFDRYDRQEGCHIKLSEVPEEKDFVDEFKQRQIKECGLYGAYDGRPFSWIVMPCRCEVVAVCKQEDVAAADQLEQYSETWLSAFDWESRYQK